MKNKKSRVLLLAMVMTVVFASATALMAYAKAIPVKKTLESGVTLYSNTKSTIDASNLAEGFVSVKYTGGKTVNIKLQITKTGGTTYTYNLNNKGTYEIFPLTEGNGVYAIKVFENTGGTKYAQAFSQNVTLALSNELAPYLYPNQYVNFTDKSKTVAKGLEVTKGKTKDLDKLTAVYSFVVNNFTYDTKLAETVTSGYLPDVDKVLAAKKGICFDYAAVMATMLRSQGIPCKLVVGYAGKTYHAWINTYLDDVGWVEKAVYFDGKSWKLMDPTFASTGKGDPKVAKYIGDGTNYTQKFAY